MHRTWLVSRVIALLALIASATGVDAQSPAVIRGTVTDSASGQAIAAASIFIAGTSVRAMTDASGEFQLSGMSPGAHLVQVRALGFAPAERSVTAIAGTSTTANFVLIQRPTQLQEVVVVGYGTTTRRELTTAIASVTGEEVQGTPLAGVDAAMQGRIPGVQITQNAGNPGNAVTMRIRGSSSIGAGNQPLWVIDGVPVLSGDFSQLGMGGQNLNAVSGLSPDEVESVDILKDAAAAAIYGSRGSNGVVLITTKRGRSGPTRVTFNAYSGTQEASRRLELLDAAEWLEYFNESAANDGRNPLLYGEPGVDDQFGADWQDAILRTAPVSSFEMGVSGGESRIRYNIMGTYFDQQGIVIGSAYDRITGRANMDVTASDRVSFSASLGLTREITQRVENDGSTTGIITNAVGNWPLAPPRQPDGSYTPRGGDYPTGVYYPNPLAIAELNSAEARTIRALGNIRARLILPRSFSLTSTLGFDILSMRENQYESPLVVGTYASSAGGIAKTGFSNGNRVVAESYLSFDDVFAEQHALSFTAGAAVERDDDEWNFVRGEGLASDRLHRVANAANIVLGDASASEARLVSFFSRANYVLAGRYTLGASIRTDGSSRFGPNRRFGVFPALSAAWVLSDESFFALPAVSQFKLRGSWGVTGNQPLSRYPFQGLVGTASYDNLPGIAQSSLENRDLQWESTRQVNLGVDLRLLDDRIGLIADVYDKRTENLLLSRPITLTSGFSSVFDNVGSMSNKGFELSLHTINVQAPHAGGIQWSTRMNLSHNRNRVTKLADGEPYTTGERSVNRVEEGQPLGAFFLIKFLGVDPATGNAIYEDVNGDGVINSDDRQIVGTPHPKYTGGIGNTLEVGGFDLSAFVQFSQGADIFNAIRIFSDAGAYYYDNHFRHVLDRWQNPGDITNEPRASYGGRSGARTISSRFVEDGSYVRLQDVTIGYSLPARLTGTAGMRNARLYLAGRNLFTWTDYIGYSPDVNSNGTSTASLGTDFYAYPLARTFMIGVQGGW